MQRSHVMRVLTSRVLRKAGFVEVIGRKNCPTKQAGKSGRRPTGANSRTGPSQLPENCSTAAVQES